MSESPVGDYDLQAFRARSNRFLFAARKSDDGKVDDRSVVSGQDLVYLEQGTARAVRELARKELRCPEPLCPSPAITTVSRSTAGARDGFRHLRRPTEGAHGAEGALHRQAKALIARWAAAHPDVADVVVEARVADGERIADVLLVSHRGNRLAVEVQYAGLSVDDWLLRSQSFIDHGIEVAWVWGNSGPQSPLADRTRSLHREAIARRRPLLWINPTDETIAWAVGGTHEVPLPVDHDREFRIELGDLSQVDLRRTGLYPPDWSISHRNFDEAKIAMEAAAARAAEEERERLQRRRAADLEAARQAREERERNAADRIAEGQTRRSQRIERRRAQEAPALGPRRRHCVVCGSPLDHEALANSDRHFGDCGSPVW